MHRDRWGVLNLLFPFFLTRINIANGDTHKVINAAHTLRNDDFGDRVRNAKDTGEEFDLVVVGSGFAGCTAAYTYLKAKPDAKILILDNNDMFGGVARHNEFEVDGYKLWAPAGSPGAAKITIGSKYYESNPTGFC